MTKLFIIAEAGSNFRSGEASENDLVRAIELIRVAAEAGCDAVKFQLWETGNLYTPGAGSYSGQDVNKLLDSLALSPDWIPILAREAERLSIEFMCTPFSLAAVDLVDPFVRRHKIASYELGYRDLIKHAAKKGKPIILSTGAATESEVDRACLWAEEASPDPNLTLLHCTAAYPAPLDQANLRAMVNMDSHWPFGLSDHSTHPTLLPVASVALGASMIEKHFTLSRKLEGPDHAFALEPGELVVMVAAIRQIEKSLGDGNKAPQPCEEGLRVFARRSVQAGRDLPKGTKLTTDDIAILRPGSRRRGAEPYELSRLVGSTLSHDIREGDGVIVEDIE